MDVRRLYDQDDVDRAVEVAPGITMVHLARRHNPGHHGWAILHACPGIWRDNGEDMVYLVAPFIASDLVSEEPLTFSPSIHCLGAARLCGLHGFVTDGVWVDAGTPPETMSQIVAARPDPVD